MIIVLEKPTLARAVIAQNGYRVFAGTKQILLPEIPLGPQRLPVPGFWVGNASDDLLESKPYSTNSMAYLVELGFGIYARPVKSNKFRKGQHVEYFLGRISTTTTQRQLSAFPRDHSLTHDLANKRIMLTGPNVLMKRWVDLQPKYKMEEQGYQNIYELLKNKDSLLRNYRHEVMGTEKKDFVAVRNMIPVGRNESDELVCIPAEMNDMPRIGIYGQSGQGKTTLRHFICDFAVTYLGMKVGDLNDYQCDATTWSYKTDEPEELKRLNLTPTGLPIVYLTPHQRGSEEPPYQKEGVGHFISLSFEEVISNFHEFFDLKDSAKYFSLVRDDIINQCQTADDVINMFATGDKDMSYSEYRARVKAKEIPPRDVPQPNSVTAVGATMKELEDRQVIDRWIDIPSKWTIWHDGSKLGEFDPFLACLMVGTMPVLETKDMINRPYFPAYFRYFVKKIMEMQRNRVTNIGKIMLCIDEFSLVKSIPIIEELQRRGRQHGIGTIISDQNYKGITGAIKDNCNYILVFQTPSADEIAEDYYLKPTRETAHRIKSLPRFHFMAYSTQDGFIVFDHDGNTRTEKGPIYCTSLRTMSKHKAPPEDKKRR